MSKLLIWGASGHAKVVLDVVRATQRWEEIVFVDDAFPATAPVFMGHRVEGTSQLLPALRERGFKDFLIAIGDNKIRARCFAASFAQGIQPAIAVHPSAVVSPSASIGAGTVVMPRAVINASAVVGVNCIVNTAAVIEHDCIIGPHVHLSPGAVLGGGVKIGAYAHAGIHASLLPLAEIGESAVIGAGAVVLKSVASGQTVVGVPAKPVASQATAFRGR